MTIEPDSALQQKMLAMYHDYKTNDFAGVPDITVAYIKANPSRPFVLVDVREKKEIAVSRIPGALTVKEFEKQKSSLKGSVIVPYCTIGYRSGLYTAKLRKQGFDAYNLVGGVLAWAFEGQRFDGPHGETDSVHVYGKEWNLLPSRCTAVW